MKKYLLFFVLSAFPFFGWSQEKEKEKKKEEDPLKKAEAAFDKAFDGLFKTKKKEETTTKADTSKEKVITKDTKEEKSGGGFGGFTLGGKPKASYNFVSSMTMKMTMTEPKKKTQNVLQNKYFFGADDKAVGIKFIGSSNSDMQKASATMEMIVMDLEQNKMFTFTNNNGTKNLMAIGFKPDKLEQYAKENDEQIKITKTSETKTIAGYKCDGYKVEDQESKDQVLMWISQSRVGEFAKLGQKMGYGSGGVAGKSAQKNYMAYYAHPELAKMAKEGRAVLGYSVKAENGNTVDMEIEEVKLSDKSTFDTSTYKSLF
jgi:hypothetical protein